MTAWWLLLSNNIGVASAQQHGRVASTPHLRELLHLRHNRLVDVVGRRLL